MIQRNNIFRLKEILKQKGNYALVELHQTTRKQMTGVVKKGKTTKPVFVEVPVSSKYALVEDSTSGAKVINYHNDYLWLLRKYNVLTKGI